MNLADRADRANHAGQKSLRQYALTDVEFRADDDTGRVVFEGVASVVDHPYTVRDIFGEFTETIAPGAFNKTLRDSKANIALHVNHRWDDVPLADRSSGTLQLVADPNLRVSASLDPNRPDVAIIRSAVSEGIMRRMSIGFSVPKGKDDWSNDWTERTVHEVKLMETSIVWRGANDETTAAVRTLDEVLNASDDWTDAEVRRAIAHFESLLAATETASRDANFAARDAADRERLERLRLLRL